MVVLNEDLFDDVLVMEVPDVNIEKINIPATSEVPEIGPEMGISTLLMNVIKDTYTMIDSFNSLYVALSDNNDVDKMNVVEQIVAEETSHIGTLQALLKDFSPNIENIDAGEELIANSITESLDSVETPNEVKIFTEMSIDDFKNLSVDDGLKIIKNAFNCFKNDYNEILSIEDDIDYMDDIYSIKRNFYKKYLEFAKKCEEYLKNGRSISGYGINDILKIKIKELCQTVSMHFPYGWK